MQRESRENGSRRGASLIEFLLLGSLIALVVIGAVSAMHGNLQVVVQEISQKLPAVR